MSFAPDAIRFIDAPTLRNWLNDGDELALLNVREAGKFGEGHPFFAIPLPFSRLELGAPRLLSRKSVRIALVDDGTHAAGDGFEHASVARRAATRLRELGYGDIAILDGGVEAWRAAGYTLFRGVNVPSKTFGELVEHAYGTPHVSPAQLQRWRIEHGSTRSYADVLPAGSGNHERKDARIRAQALAQRFGVCTLEEGSALAWRDDPRRTAYLLDVCTPEEFARDSLPAATHAPGGQLIQANDQTVAVRRAQLLLIDYDGIRAPVVAHWLVQLGFETALVDAATAARWSAPDHAQLHAGSTVSPLVPPLASNAVVLDLRSSAAHKEGRPAGSHWTIRPRVFQTLRRADANRETPVVLLTDPAGQDARLTRGQGSA